MDRAPLTALIGTVDRALAEQGIDPDIVYEGDKILIAVQYVEMATIRESMTLTIPPERDPR